jgi:hypothetical protein
MTFRYVHTEKESAICIPKKEVQLRAKYCSGESQLPVKKYMM